MLFDEMMLKGYCLNLDVKKNVLSESHKNQYNTYIEKTDAICL